MNSFSSLPHLAQFDNLLHPFYACVSIIPPFALGREILLAITLHHTAPAAIMFVFAKPAAVHYAEPKPLGHCRWFAPHISAHICPLLAGTSGIEPELREPKSRALPLGYTPVFYTIMRLNYNETLPSFELPNAETEVCVATPPRLAYSESLGQPHNHGTLQPSAGMSVGAVHF